MMPLTPKGGKRSKRGIKNQPTLSLSLMSETNWAEVIGDSEKRFPEVAI
jgi:hypothetical protein